MRGLRFYRDSVSIDHEGDAPIFIHGRIDDTRSDFDYLFRPIYARLAELLYAEERGEWSIEGCDYRICAAYENRSVGAVPGWYIMPGSVLDRFGKYFLDDWNTLVFCVPGTNFTIVGNVTNHVLLGKKESFIDNPAASVCIHNWDGVYWELFDKDQTTLETLRTVHGGDSHMEMFWVDYEQDFPNPRNSPLERVSQNPPRFKQ